MTTDNETERETVEMYVETAPYAQQIDCPNCGRTEAIIIGDEKIGGYLCRGCSVSVDFIHDRNPDDQSDDDTEQTLITDGGRQRDMDVCQYDGCSGPADYYVRGKRLCVSHYNTEWLRRQR